MTGRSHGDATAGNTSDACHGPDPPVRDGRANGHEVTQVTSSRGIADPRQSLGTIDSHALSASHPAEQVGANATPARPAVSRQSPAAANDGHAQGASHHNSEAEYPIEDRGSQPQASEEPLTEARELADLEDFFGPDAHLL